MIILRIYRNIYTIARESYSNRFLRSKSPFDEPLSCHCTYIIRIYVYIQYVGVLMTMMTRLINNVRIIIINITRYIDIYMYIDI